MAIKIALAGNPNCGKTTLFNALTGSNQFVGNWPGVTVEKKEGKLKGHKDVTIMDLPGIYSLSPYTLEEVVARNYLINERPDAILNIVDGTNIERNLYLSTQIMELGIPVIMAVNMADLLEKNGIHIPLHHCSNSAGIIRVPEANLNIVRAGITIYGIYPSEEVEKDIVMLKPVMSLKSHVSYVKDVEPGVQVSYGGTYTTDHVTKMATIPVGYADGYPRMLSNKGWVLIHGKKAPICGRVCMDQFMVDVTEIPDVKTGDEVTLLGKDGDEVISADTLGDLSGRFSYEFVCNISKRVPRIYIRDGKECGELTYFD